MRIRVDDLRGSEIAALLRAHLEFAHSNSPPESVHALDLEALRVPEITFWSAWDGPALLGCAALRQIDPAHGEVKSMHTAQPKRGRGVASALLAHLIGKARARGYRRLSLETGSTDAFAPARALYARLGFVPTGPFAGYVLDPNSVFLTLDLASDPFELERFVQAQAGSYAQAVAELRAGSKQSHWMWFVFPQFEGLGASATSRRYAIRSLAEARQYLVHPVLGARLAECTRIVNGLAGRSALEIFGPPDDMKFFSSMTLFEMAAGPHGEFSVALDRYFAGRRDARTRELVQAAGSP